MDEVTMPEKTPEQKEAIRQIMEPDKTPNWLLPLIFVVVAVFLLVYISKSCNDIKPNPNALHKATSQVHIGAILNSSALYS